jgi:hypothetical protein
MQIYRSIPQRFYPGSLEGAGSRDAKRRNTMGVQALSVAFALHKNQPLSFLVDRQPEAIQHRL